MYELFEQLVEQYKNVQEQQLVIKTHYVKPRNF